MNKSFTKVGLFGNGGDASTNIAERGAVHEFGTKSGKIPSRPFNRQAFSKNLKKTEKVVAIWYNKVIDGKSSTKKALQNIGEWFEGKLKEEITSGGFVALKSATSARKGSSKPLIDTGDMRRRITHKEVIK